MSELISKSCSKCSIGCQRSALFAVLHTQFNCHEAQSLCSRNINNCLVPSIFISHFILLFSKTEQSLSRLNVLSKQGLWNLAIMPSLRNSICLLALWLLLFMLRVRYICEIENTNVLGIWFLYTVDIFLIISIEPVFIFELTEGRNIFCSFSD